MPCSTSDELSTRVSAFDAGGLDFPVKSNTIDESSIDEQASGASLTVNQTPESGSHSLPDAKIQVQFDASTFAAEEVSSSSRRADSSTLALISEDDSEVNNNTFADEVYCICDGTASDDDLSNNDSPRPTFIVLPGESEGDPPRTYRFIYELGEYQGWHGSQRRQSGIHAIRKFSMNLMPEPSRSSAQRQHRRAYRARMAYLERLVEVAHNLGKLTTAANFDEELWPELKRMLGLE